jgi:transcriptional regulator with XRE-family HTH domain
LSDEAATDWHASTAGTDVVDNGVMDEATSLRAFLTSRRAAIDPGQVGLPRSTVARRKRGLRREEVAVLAGVSVDYYARLEQGRIGNVSNQVLTAIEDALQLDELERSHLRTLISPQPPGPTRQRVAKLKARPAIRRLLDAMDPVPAILQGPRLEVLATNRAARVLVADFDAMAPAMRNIARWLFLDPAARVTYPQWDEVAAPVVATLRANLSPHTHDEELEDLVGELSEASTDFARFWADYQLYRHGHGKKRFFHEAVGTMTLNYETLNVPGDEGMFVSTYTADVGSPSDEKLRLLLSWSADAPDAQRRAST